MKKRVLVRRRARSPWRPTVTVAAVGGRVPTARRRTSTSTSRCRSSWRRARPSTRRRRPAARRSSSSRPRASVPFVLDDLEQHEADRRAGRRQDDDLAEPGPALAVGAGHERRDRAEGERDRPPRRQRPGRRCSRRSRRPRRRASRRSSRTSTTTTRSRRRTSAASSTSRTTWRAADRRPGDRRHEGQGQRARRHDQPGQVDGADGRAGSSRSSRKFCKGCKLTFTDVTIADSRPRSSPTSSPR